MLFFSCPISSAQKRAFCDEGKGGQKGGEREGLDEEESNRERGSPGVLWCVLLSDCVLWNAGVTHRAFDSTDSSFYWGVGGVVCLCGFVFLDARAGLGSLVCVRPLVFRGGGCVFFFFRTEWA